MPEDVPGAQHTLLTSKWGPLPVWAWALAGLAAAWLYAKWRSNQAATADTTTADTSGDAQSQDVAPQFIIENNLPPTSTPSAPVSTTPAPPVVTPPGTTPSPPTNVRPIGPQGGPVFTKPAPSPAKKQPIAYKVVHGDSLSKIAAKYHVPGGREALWKYNTTPGNRPASSIATLKKRGPNLLFAGETILIPPQ
jgi:cytoskeletal protein RodZ